MHGSPIIHDELDRFAVSEVSGMVLVFPAYLRVLGSGLQVNGHASLVTQMVLIAIQCMLPNLIGLTRQPNSPAARGGMLCVQKALPQPSCLTLRLHECQNVPCTQYSEYDFVHSREQLTWCAVARHRMLPHKHGTQ